MSQEEILEYVKENYELPQGAEQYLGDIDFVLEILKIESAIMFDLPLEIQKKVLLIDDKYLDSVSDIREMFKDEKFANELVNKNNDVLLMLRGISLDNDYIKNLTISYIKGEKIPTKGSKLEKTKQRNIYLLSIKEVQEDHELCQYLIEQNIYYLPYIKDASIRDNPQYIIQYVKKYPHTFSKYLDKISNHLTADLLEVVIKADFQNYKLIDKDNPLMKQFYESLDRIKKVRPELKMDNPNLRYELLMDSEFVKLDINIINSLLEYNTGNIDKIIQIRNDGKLDYLIKYIEQYSNLYGNNLENIQNAISTFDKIEDLLINTNNFDGLTIDEEKLKSIISTGNKFGINSVEDLQNYEELVRDYYATKIKQATTSEEIKQIYNEMLFNTSNEKIEEFIEEYCNNNIFELSDYAERNEKDNPINSDVKKRYELYNRINSIEDIEQLRTLFSSIPLTICDLDETKQKISQMYSEIYNDEMLDLEDDTIKQSEYKGVKVLKLSGQSFNICVHRIFNFDFNMNGIANEILNNPEQWSLSEGSNTISTTLITDRKIAALFRPLQREHESRFYML